MGIYTYFILIRTTLSLTLKGSTIILAAKLVIIQQITKYKIHYFANVKQKIIINRKISLQLHRTDSFLIWNTLVTLGLVTDVHVGHAGWH